MNGQEPEFFEAIRLLRKFFPEARRFVTDTVGLHWECLGEAMAAGDQQIDYSCDPFRRADQPDLGFAAIGGFNGRQDEVYLRILQHTRIGPEGRAVVVPDAIGFETWCSETLLPFVCDSRTVPERLREFRVFGTGDRDAAIVFESGEAILVDHHYRLHWAISRIRRR